MKRSRFGIVAVVAMLLFATTVAYEFNRAQQHLDRQHRALADARLALSNARVALAGARAQRAKLQTADATTRRQVVNVNKEHDFYETLLRNDKATSSDVLHQFSQTEIAVFGVATNTNTVTHCLNGVTTAASANQHGNTRQAVASLNDSATDCAKTFALSTGALSPYDFPDPYVLYARGAYYAYSTNSGAGDIQVMRSTDLASWQFVGNGLAAIPGWALPNATWAPAVLARGGRYLLYYTIPAAGQNRRCVSVAVSSSPAGPFVDGSSGPLVCPPFTSAIDPSPYVDAGGNPYLLWKQDSGPAIIWSQPLSDDGLSLVGTASQLIHADQSFERGVVEAPSMVGIGGRFYLFYSAASWQTANYTTAYAVCASPSGPCLKPANNRVLVSGSRMAGPGGMEAFLAGDGSLHAAFAAYSASSVGYPASRYFHIAALGFSNGRPYVAVKT
jgi:Glycosyl hydrolases family 43